MVRSNRHRPSNVLLARGCQSLAWSLMLPEHDSPVLAQPKTEASMLVLAFSVQVCMPQLQPRDLGTVLQLGLQLPYLSHGSNSITQS